MYIFINLRAQTVREARNRIGIFQIFAKENPLIFTCVWGEARSEADESERMLWTAARRVCVWVEGCAQLRAITGIVCGAARLPCPSLQSTV